MFKEVDEGLNDGLKLKIIILLLGSEVLKNAQCHKDFTKLTKSAILINFSPFMG